MIRVNPKWSNWIKNDQIKIQNDQIKIQNDQIELKMIKFNSTTSDLIKPDQIESKMIKLNKSNQNDKI